VGAFFLLVKSSTRGPHALQQPVVEPEPMLISAPELLPEL